MQHEQELWHDRIEDAALAVVMQLGGYKRVGPEVYPEVDDDQAANRLRDALNPARREHLSPHRLLRLLEAGRAGGAHVLMTWLCRKAGYSDPVPITPDDEPAELARRVEHSVSELGRIVERLEVLGISPEKLIKRVA